MANNHGMDYGADWPEESAGRQAGPGRRHGDRDRRGRGRGVRAVPHRPSGPADRRDRRHPGARRQPVDGVDRHRDRTPAWPRPSGSTAWSERSTTARADSGHRGGVPPLGRRGGDVPERRPAGAGRGARRRRRRHRRGRPRPPGAGRRAPRRRRGHYGLGNFVFRRTAPRAPATGVFEVTVTGRRVDGYRWNPARSPTACPARSSGAAATAALAHWDGLRSCTGLDPLGGRSPRGAQLRASCEVVRSLWTMGISAIVFKPSAPFGIAGNVQN